MCELSSIRPEQSGCVGNRKEVQLQRQISEGEVHPVTHEPFGKSDLVEQNTDSSTTLLEKLFQSIQLKIATEDLWAIGRIRWRLGLASDTPDKGGAVVFGMCWNVIQNVNELT